jgi:hypothetical protein
MKTGLKRLGIQINWNTSLTIQTYAHRRFLRYATDKYETENAISEATMYEGCFYRVLFSIDKGK